jgi:hypothetical protein
MTYEDVTVREFIKADSRGQRFVLGAGETVDELTASGQWLASDVTMEIEQ